MVSFNPAFFASLATIVDSPFAEEVERQQRLLRELPAEGLPAGWGISRVAGAA
jgi:hypothetical protein